MNKKQNGNRMYRDALFKYVFGNEDHKEFALSLYNAINHSHYENKEDIILNTLEDVLYMKVKNDVSFLLNQSMVLFEQQSTWNPNMPYRMLEYVYMEWKAILSQTPYDVYMPYPLSLPAPQCIVFYNGRDVKDFKDELKLSDLYSNYQKGCLELTAKVYNINGNSGSDLLKKCRPLYEYTWVIDQIKERHNKTKDPLSEVILDVLDMVPENFLIRELLLKEKREVQNMLLTEFDEEEYQKAVKRYKARLRKDAEEKILQKGKETLILRMLSNGMSKDEISKMTEEPLEWIQSIAEQKK